eukprot:5638683-Pleurochrysis_carterae.AAC.2
MQFNALRLPIKRNDSSRTYMQKSKAVSKAAAASIQYDSTSELCCWSTHTELKNVVSTNGVARLQFRCAMPYYFDASNASIRVHAAGTPKTMLSCCIHQCVRSQTRGRRRSGPPDTRLMMESSDKMGSELC